MSIRSMIVYGVICAALLFTLIMQIVFMSRVLGINNTFIKAGSVYDDCRGFAMEKETVRFMMSGVGNVLGPTIVAWRTAFSINVVLVVASLVIIGVPDLLDELPVGAGPVLIPFMIVALIASSIGLHIVSESFVPLLDYSKTYSDMMQMVRDNVIKASLVENGTVPITIENRIRARLDQELNNPTKTRLNVELRRALDVQNLPYYLSYHKDNNDMPELLHDKPGSTAQLRQNYLYPGKDVSKEPMRSLAVLRGMQVPEAVGTDPNHMNEARMQLQNIMGGLMLQMIPICLLLFLVFHVVRKKSNLVILPIVMLTLLIASIFMFIISRTS